MWNSCLMQVASLRERLLAAFVDAAVVMLGVAVAVGLGIAGEVAYEHLRGRDEDEVDQDGREDEEEVSPLRFGGDRDDVDDQGPPSCGRERGTHGFLRSPLLRATVSGASAGLVVASRNWRSPGFRVLGLRRVDARTGGAITVRSALSGLLFDQAHQAATRPLFQSSVHRGQRRLRELAPSLKETEREHATDPQARQRAVTEFYEANAVHALAGCGWQLAGPIVSQLVLAMAIRDRRTVYDRVTGTIVVTVPRE